MSAENNGSIFALDEFSQTDDLGEEEEIEFREDELIYPADEDQANLGGGLAGSRYEGYEQSYVYLSDLFNLNGTLDERHRAVYLESEEGDTIVRVEQDGSWIKVEAPYWASDDVPMTRGRVGPDDFATRMMYSDGRIGEPIIIFGNGFGPLWTIEAITTVPIKPLKLDSWSQRFYEEVDALRNFQEYVTAASKNPANWGMDQPASPKV